MAGLTTTLKVAMFRLRDPDKHPMGCWFGHCRIESKRGSPGAKQGGKIFSALINPNKLDASRLLGWLLSERIEQVG